MNLSNTPDYFKDLLQVFSEQADPENAFQMKKYMKGKFNFFGIKAPERKELSKIYWKHHGYLPDANPVKAVKWCWESDQREFQYFAMDSLAKIAKNPTIDFIEMYEFMVINKSWWDTVDFIASNLAGPYFIKFPKEISSTTKKWMKSNNIWLQRTCLLFQLKYRDRTDTSLLEDFINPLSGSNEFFIQKAIGWALREYSKNNQDWVTQFVSNNSLSNLSKREALKWMKNKSVIK